MTQIDALSSETLLTVMQQLDYPSLYRAATVSKRLETTSRDVFLNTTVVKLSADNMGGGQAISGKCLSNTSLLQKLAQGSEITDLVLTFKTPADFTLLEEGSKIRPIRVKVPEYRECLEALSWADHSNCLEAALSWVDLSRVQKLTAAGENLTGTVVSQMPELRIIDSVDLEDAQIRAIAASCPNLEELASHRIVFGDWPMPIELKATTFQELLTKCRSLKRIGLLSEFSGRRILPVLLTPKLALPELHIEVVGFVDLPSVRDPARCNLTNALCTLNSARTFTGTLKFAELYGDDYNCGPSEYIEEEDYKPWNAAAQSAASACHTFQLVLPICHSMEDFFAY